jgi:hypothetical protein
MKGNLVWRGAWGGILGAVLLVFVFILEEKIRLGYVPYSGALLVNRNNGLMQPSATEFFVLGSIYVGCLGVLPAIVARP